MWNTPNATHIWVVDSHWSQFNLVDSDWAYFNLVDSDWLGTVSAAMHACIVPLFSIGGTLIHHKQNHMSSRVSYARMKSAEMQIEFQYVNFNKSSLILFSFRNRELPYRDINCSQPIQSSAQYNTTQFIIPTVWWRPTMGWTIGCEWSIWTKFREWVL
jgi:hypothetical protein